MEKSTDVTLFLEKMGKKSIHLWEKIAVTEKKVYDFRIIYISFLSELISEVINILIKEKELSIVGKSEISVETIDYCLCNLLEEGDIYIIFWPAELSEKFEQIRVLDTVLHSEVHKSYLQLKNTNY